MIVKTPLPPFQIRLPKLLFLGPDLFIFIKYNVLWIVWLLFDMVCWVLMVKKAGEINLFFTTFVNKTTMDSFSLFHQLFEPLKIHRTILNSNQTIHKTLYLMKMDKSGPKNNNYGSLIWNGGSGVLTTISVGFRYLPKLSRYLYDHKSIKLAGQVS